MSATEFQLFQEHRQREWVRLRTLVLLRWIAIIGQTVAIFVAINVYNLKFEYGLAAMTVGASVIANLFSIFLYPENKRLSGRETFLMLVFDILQLGLLLFLTGGLHNPFALLMMAPVTIAATALRLQNTVILGGITIVIITALSFYYMPLTSDSGFPLILPGLFRFGYWLALVVGIIFMSGYTRRVTVEMQTMGDALVATQLALTREQKLTDLGGVVAAAAHELGTPLATIKLVSSELMEELDTNQELFDDAKLIRDQADRCRDILRSMGRAGKDDQHLKQAPLETVVREAGDPHQNRGKSVIYDIYPAEGAASRQPLMFRRPEIIHGLRNLIQNAVDFSNTRVHIDCEWNDETVSIRISDDGDGFSPHVISRIGDPFMRRRRSADLNDQRPGYEGMGMGLFIAKTLLERTGAKLRFTNRGDFGDPDAPKGALVWVEWPRSLIEPKQNVANKGLGENHPFTG